MQGSSFFRSRAQKVIVLKHIVFIWSPFRLEMDAYDAEEHPYRQGTGNYFLHIRLEKPKHWTIELVGLGRSHGVRHATGKGKAGAEAGQAKGVEEDEGDPRREVLIVERKR